MSVFQDHDDGGGGGGGGGGGSGVVQAGRQVNGFSSRRRLDGVRQDHEKAEEEKAALEAEVVVAVIEVGRCCSLC